MPARHMLGMQYWTVIRKTLLRPGQSGQALVLISLLFTYSANEYLTHYSKWYPVILATTCCWFDINTIQALLFRSRVM